MYLIALCDDEEKELDKTEQMLSAYQRSHTGCMFIVRRFKSAPELLDAVKQEEYAPDLLLLDIYMPHKNGMFAARQLREMGNEGRIIFLTTSKEHALDAFGVGATQYLVKPVTEKELFPVLEKSLGEIDDRRNRYLLLRIDGRIQRVALDQILACEAQGKRQCLHLADGTQATLRMTIAELSKMLSEYEEFVKVGASYIINLAHVDSLNCQEVCLDSGKNIYLPRGAYASLRERYFRYYCGGG